jgi:outer membrane protein assembly factor BamB
MSKCDNPYCYDISNNPDFTSLHITPDGNIFSLAQFESSSPAGFYVSKVI